MSEHFSLHKFSDTALFQALSSDAFALAEVERHERARYLYRYLSDVGAKAMVVESNYVDHDYLDDFASYYVTCFRPYQRRCRRLHFFSEALTEAQFLEALTSKPATENTALQRFYLGFVVARPLPGAIVGRTVLVTYPSDGGRRNYPCVKKYRANLFGLDLSIESLAFQEQDRVLAACATVALWCCFHKTADMFGTSSPGPAAITRAANQLTHSTRPIPSRGLNVQQICNAITHVGLEPEVIQVQKNTPLISLIHAHVATGVPVILGLEVEGVGLHAVTVVGYSLKSERHLEQEVASGERSIPMIGLRINELYAHDDQHGPFSRIIIKPATIVSGMSYPVAFEGSWQNKSTGKRLAMYPRVVIIPVYDKIRVTFLEMQTWLARLSGLMPLILERDARFEWDVRLALSNDLKRQFRTASHAHPMIEALLLQGHPRFVWHGVLSVDGIRVVELLGDATDMARSFPIYCAVWHHDKFRRKLAQLLAPQMAELVRNLLTERFYAFLKAAAEEC